MAGKIYGSDFNATSSEVAIESIEVAHEGMERTWQAFML